MRLYKTKNGIIIEKDAQFYFSNENPIAIGWENFINDDDVLQKAEQLISTLKPSDASLLNELLPPIGNNQELWACGVTYLRSKVGRQEESKASGGADFYAKVYEAERPEVFFKSTPHRIVGHNAFVRIRKDSTWDVPEPELTLVVTSSGKIVGYTIGNDMSSRSIEGENPLDLPQAKSYDKSASVGPCIYLTEEPLPPSTTISITTTRKEKIFEGAVNVGQIKRSFKELIGFLFRE